MNMQMDQQNPVSLFNLARQRGVFHQLTNLFSKHDHTLLDLDDVTGDAAYSQRYDGLKSVNIDSIRGTQGSRTIDFDHHFHPLTDRVRDRWVSVASARENEIPLDVVRLIRVDESYFVVDGHHRISVARTLGEAAVDAEVTVLEIDK
jgi:hypothetical protein